MTKSQKLVAFIVFVLILGLLFPYLNKFAYPVQSAYSDVTISHYPNLYYLQQTIRQTGQVPLWSPTILSGYPFAANPLSGMWYPPLWLAILFNGATGLNLVVVLHLFLGAYGMLLFLQEEGIPFGAALLGGVSFELMPKVHAHFAAGHITMVCAVMLTPWLLWYTKRYRAEVKMHASVGSGMILGGIALVDLRWAAYAGALWAAYSLYLFLQTTWRSWKDGARSFWKTAARTCLRMGISVMLALGIAAPQLVPLLEYSPLTTRSLLTSADNLSFALPLERLINLLFPDIGGYAEFTIYPGAIVLLLFVYAMMDKVIWKRQIFWFATFVVSAVYAVGDVFVLNKLLIELPGFGLLRVPSRALFISNMAAIVIVCETLAYMMRAGEEKARNVKMMAMVVVVMLAVMLSLGLLIMMGEIPFEMGFGSAVLVLAILLLAFILQGKLAGQTGIALLISLAVLDLGTINHCSIDFWTFEDIASQGREAAAYLGGQDGIFRVYSPSYSLPQHTAVLNGLELADGIDPLQLRAYSEYMEEATGVESPVYSVTIPAFFDAEVATANAEAMPDPQLLGKLNVRYVVSAFEIDMPGLVIEKQFDEVWVYQNEQVYPRAWVETGGATKDVNSFEQSPNLIKIEAEGPGLLVASEMAYPGWIVEVDGFRQEIEKVDGLFRGVELLEGSHEVHFAFRPKSVMLGCLIGLVSWLVCGVHFFVFQRRQDVT